VRAMFRPLLFAGTALAAACGTTVDDRPTTIENVTSSVLVPNCANAQCHSAFKQAAGYAFDTVENFLASGADIIVSKGDPDASLLYLVLVSPGGENQLPRMPYDQPLPDADVKFIRTWISEGADGIP
jgi:hypothetical protein